jgi:hypothetical protein
MRTHATRIGVPTCATARAQEAEVEQAGAYAVIAPQMGKQLVAFQARTRRAFWRACRL